MTSQDIVTKKDDIEYQINIIDIDKLLIIFEDFKDGMLTKECVNTIEFISNLAQKICTNFRKKLKDLSKVLNPANIVSMDDFTKKYNYNSNYNISIIESLIHYYDFDICLIDSLLLFKIIGKNIYTSCYLIDKGCDPTKSILKHSSDGDWESSYHISLDFISYCIKKNVDVSWLYLVSKDSIYNLRNCTLSFQESDDLLKLFQYLIKLGYNNFPKSIYVDLQHNECLKTLEWLYEFNSENVKFNDLLAEAIFFHQESAQLLIKYGARIDLNSVAKKYQVKPLIEYGINELLKLNHTHEEILEIMKRVYIG
jgi:hypothetical protein